jgi:hypothetical protein
MKIELGNKARDIVSGLEGLVTGRAVYINGCVQYCVKPTIGADGKMPESWWIDEAQIEVTGPGIAVPAPLRAVGGPQESPGTFRPC